MTQEWNQPVPPSNPPKDVKPRKKRRVFMWIILAINILFLILIISMLNTESSCQGMTGDELDMCQAGEGIGKSIGFFAFLFFWMIVDVILAVIFVVTRKRAGTYGE